MSIIAFTDVFANTWRKLSHSDHYSPKLSVLKCVGVGKADGGVTSFGHVSVLFVVWAAGADGRHLRSFREFFTPFRGRNILRKSFSNHHHHHFHTQHSRSQNNFFQRSKKFETLSSYKNAEGKLTFKDNMCKNLLDNRREQANSQIGGNWGFFCAVMFLWTLLRKKPTHHPVRTIFLQFGKCIQFSSQIPNIAKIA